MRPKHRIDKLSRSVDVLTEEAALLQDKAALLQDRLERSKERLVLLELWATGHGYQHPDWPSQSQT
jgi:hypothetical protein